ncbi:MAG: hypothetical protein AAGB93_10870 [Planctomycetota bacterium]
MSRLLPLAALALAVGCAAVEDAQLPLGPRSPDPSSERGAPPSQGPEGFAPPPYLGAGFVPDARDGRHARPIALSPLRHPSQLRRRDSSQSAASGTRPGRTRTVVFDVRDLLWVPPSFAAPELGVLPSGAMFGVPETLDGGSRWSEEVLLDAIRAAVAPGTWDEDGNSIEIVDGKLFVTRK